jgi:hypothetical protein
MEIDIPEIVAEVTAEFEAYERALVENDVAALNRFFWKDDRALRYGFGEHLYGHAAIAAFRAARPAADTPPRQVLRQEIHTFGRDFAVTNIQSLRPGQTRTGRQSQTWVRTAEGWRIVAAHVSLMG